MGKRNYLIEIKEETKLNLAFISQFTVQRKAYPNYNRSFQLWGKSWMLHNVAKNKSFLALGALAFWMQIMLFGQEGLDSKMYYGRGGARGASCKLFLI